MISTPAGAPGTSRTFLGIACGMGAGALWGLVFLAPDLVRAFTPLQLAIGRYLAFGLISAGLIGSRWRTLIAAVPARGWLSLAWLSLAGNTLYYVLLSTAVQTGGIAMTSLVLGFLPVPVTIIGSRDSGAVPLRKLLPSLLLCVAGAVCIGWQAIAAPAAGAVTGLLFAVGALTSWTAYAIGNTRSLGRFAHISSQDWNLLTGVVTGLQAAALIPVTLLLEPLSHAPQAWLEYAGVSIAVALLASIGGNLLWNRMSRLLPLTLVGQMILFETLFGLLYAFAWERRLPTPLEAAAFVLVVASVLTCIAAHRRRAGLAISAAAA
ncbi:DMT family transporter [Sphingomonas desiccabilis]|uniref:DMT family transporter n=1 Tax=Sphingomonas desiccabilis TaxID=429134 RepID=A0A4Q2IZ49_9SPHN|nr:DMT family transporter [Sphingomonas desiccabilis]MBB3909959.1 drug/metabolite transporter (DMT)-like permease [Sphingomonas desiccabilis]RXZ34623.1 DMT family transporter [Sphingomonas desiccabilis]